MSFIAVKCPQCGADVQFDNSREFGFCTYCGTKVMQDKIIVEHSGNIKVDNSELINKYLANARRSLKKSDWAEVEKYYDLVEQYEPNNLEAVFYSAYGKLRCTILDEYSAKWDNDFVVLKNSISVLDDYFDIDNEKEYCDIIKEAMNYIFILMDPSKNGVIHGSNISESSKQLSEGEIKLKELTKTLFPQMIDTLDNIIKKYDDAKLDKQYLVEIKERVQKYKDACYIATAVYGSYDCPEVWTLRRFRDYSLALTWYGRLFIALYYAISPTIVKWFGHTQWFNKMWKGKLDCMIEKLHAEGYEDTPYQDKDWK